MKCIFLIDGFNFYHSITNKRHKLPKKVRWFDYRKYCSKFIEQDDTIQDIYYFTAEAFFRNEESLNRHRLFIDACEANKIKVIKGQFKLKTSQCPECKKYIEHHEEKRTDVNIALYAYRLALKANEETKIFLITGDTDLVPALKAIKEDASNIITGVIAPFNRNNQEIANEAQISKITKKELLLKCILPRCIVKDNGTKIWCPSYLWDDPN